MNTAGTDHGRQHKVSLRFAYLSDVQEIISSTVNPSSREGWGESSSSKWCILVPDDDGVIISSTVSSARLRPPTLRNEEGFQRVGSFFFTRLFDQV